jgi:hypothetical protein
MFCQNVCQRCCRQVASLNWPKVGQTAGGGCVMLVPISRAGF